VSEDLLTVRDVARITGLHPKSVYRLLDRGDLACVHIGQPRGKLQRRAVRIPQSALDALITNQQSGEHTPREKRKP
jgi:predicted DNA-binding transcriptional regulator AlpA